MEQSAFIFVSYARTDTKTVFSILDQLREQGFQFWVDQEGIEGAAFWRREIVEAIASTSAVLFFASQASCHSDNVSKELALASEEKQLIIVAQHDASVGPMHEVLSQRNADNQRLVADLAMRVIGAHCVDAERNAAALDFLFVDFVIGFSGKRDTEHSQARHGRRRFVFRFEWRLRGGNEEQAIEREFFTRGLRHEQMPKVNWIK